MPRARSLPACGTGSGPRTGDTLTSPRRNKVGPSISPRRPSPRCAITPSCRRPALELGGRANYPGNVALGASAALINELGRDAVRDHIFHLTEALIDRLRSLGALVVSPPEPEARSGIVTFTL